MTAPTDPSVHFGFAADPLRIGLSVREGATVIISVRAVTAETIVVGVGPNRTVFDRFTGLGAEGGLERHVIAPRELQRVERFAAAGAYKDLPPEPPPAAFDPDADL